MLPIYILNVCGMDDSELESAIDDIQYGYVLVDEWDMSIFDKKKKFQNKKDDNDDSVDSDDSDDNDNDKTYPSLKSWLNVLDQASGEVIFWFTSNNFDRLAKFRDGALIREGRIDHIIEFNKMTSQEVRNAWYYFNHKLPDQSRLPEINQLGDEELEKLTIAQIIKSLKHKIPITEIGKNKREEY
jgi:hypothetical protein